MNCNHRPQLTRECLVNQSCCQSNRSNGINLNATSTTNQSATTPSCTHYHNHYGPSNQPNDALLRECVSAVGQCTA